MFCTTSALFRPTGALKRIQPSGRLYSIKESALSQRHCPSSVEMSFAVFRRQAAFDAYYRHTPHNVSAKSQYFAMEIIGQRLKAFAAGCRRKRSTAGGKVPVFIHRILRVGFIVSMRFGFRTVEMRAHGGIYVNGVAGYVKGKCLFDFR